MTDDKLTHTEKAVLLVLMAEAGEVSNPDLKARFGLDLKAPSRRRLNDLKLIESRTDRRRFVHTLADKGWRRCAQELGVETPARPGPLGGALYAVLAGLGRFMHRAELSLADVFHPYDGSQPASAAEAGLVAGAGPGVGAAVGPDVEQRVRAAYRQLAGEPSDWVSLRQLRPLLGDLDRAAVDTVLTRMNRLPEVNLVPETNQKTLSRQDREAAVHIGDQEKHLLSIGA
jgi:hypothetical protein